jgi:hypothetical protein
MRVALAAAALAVGACGFHEAPRPSAVRFMMAIPQGRALASFVVSADGRWLAYSAERDEDGLRRLFIRSVAEGTASDREVPGTIGASTPFFSPDGSAVAYFSRGAIWRTSTSTGGVPQRIVAAPSDSAGGTWTADGRIVFAPLGNQGLMGVPAGGGTAVPLTTLNGSDGELEHGWPHALADGALVFTVSERGRDPHLEVLSTDGKRERLRVPIIGQAQFVETGHLVYGYLGSLMAVKFDAQEHTISNVPVPLAKGIQTATGFGVLGRSGFSVSRTGTLAWLRASADDARSRLVRVDREGKVSPLNTSADVFQTPRLSPDGRRIAVAVRDGVMTREIRVADAAKPDRVMLTITGWRQPVAGVDGQSPPDVRLESRWAAEDLRADDRSKAATRAAVYRGRDGRAKSGQLVAAAAPAGVLRNRAGTRARRAGVPRRRVGRAGGGHAGQRAIAERLARRPVDCVRLGYSRAVTRSTRPDSIATAKRVN